MTERTLNVPGDKSITHRALLLASLADGRSRIRHALDAGDTRTTADMLRALGARVPPLGQDLAINGCGLHGLVGPKCTLDCANSGTTARLLLGLLAGTPLWAVLTGDDSLRARPMRRVTAPLVSAGAHFAELGAPDRLPIAVDGGALDAIDYASPHASAQIKSALLLAGLTGGVDVRVIEPRRSRDHSERMLAAMGADIRSRPGADGTNEITFRSPARLDPLDLVVPGDFSSAAFLLAASILSRDAGARVVGVGVNPTRTGLLAVLERMGARIVAENHRDAAGEPVADLLAQPSGLHGTDVGAAEIPGMIDEVPVLAILAARASGETRITGAAELRVKESDRLASLAHNLCAVGVDAVDLADGLHITGSDAPLSGRVRTHGDHRIAMAFGVLGALPGNRIEVDDPAAASVSFPSFWSQLLDFENGR